MGSRCFGCACKFTMLRKEHGCKNCGRSFCGSCLSRTATVAKFDQKPQKVCSKCFDVLTKQGDGGNPSRPTPELSPPANYKKRVAALQAREQGQVAGPSTSRPASDMRGMSVEDREIAERLEKLKAGVQPTSAVPSQREIERRLAALRDDSSRDVPSLREMEERLAQLQGRPAPRSVGRAVHQPPDSRTQTEQANSLLTQMSEEVAIDGRFNPESTSSDDKTAMNDLNKGTNDSFPLNIAADKEGDLSKALEQETKDVLAAAKRELEFEARGRDDTVAVARRLAALKGEDPDKVVVQNLADSDSEDENEEKTVYRMLKQFGEEAAMDKASGFSERNSAATALEGPKFSQLPNPAAGANKQKTSRGVAAAVLRPSGNDSGSDDELPWCCICNEDAVLRCRGCDGDLYCKRCYREGHDKHDRPDHPTETYKATKKK
uniref:FYVE-type domain-containing protein n=1 Tax=Petromyzon marinus TaxID=7757 RepID=S4RHW5_PETMA